MDTPYEGFHLLLEASKIMDPSIFVAVKWPSLIPLSVFSCKISSWSTCFRNDEKCNFSIKEECEKEAAIYIA